jgi:hypothetical protein
MMRAKSPFSLAASMPTAVGQMEELGTRAAVVVVEACELYVLSLSTSTLSKDSPRNCR